MGNATACLSDEWALFSNVANLAWLKHPSVAMSCDALPAMPAFSKIALSACAPGKVAVGFGLFRFGDAIYNEQVVTLGTAARWNHTAVGMKVNYVRYFADGLGGRSVISVSLGSVTTLAPWVAIGIHITNVNQPFLSKLDDERLPTALTAGLRFTVAPQVIVATELEKQVNDRATWRSGLEFTVHKKFIARTGVNIHPHAACGGLGLVLRRFRADYSMMHVLSFGTRHQASIAYVFNNTGK
jgi:hypothetical protein